MTVNRLPDVFRSILVPMDTIDRVYSDIQSLTIQGATNVAVAVLDTLEQSIAQSPTIARDMLKHIATRLAYARPTEPLAQNAVRYIFLSEDRSVSERIRDYQSFIKNAKEAIPVSERDILADGGQYLTLCHSSTVVDLFTTARRAGRNFSLYVAETRPRFQGRITAKALLDAGFDDVTMVVDDVAVSLLEGQKRTIDAIFLGADLLTGTGFVNKVGSLALTAAAARHRIPVYSLTTLLKFSPDPFLPSMIETRPQEEIWADAPETLKFFAPAFDYVPFFPNVRLVTETGVIPGNKLRTAVRTQYPFIRVKEDHS